MVERRTSIMEDPVDELYYKLALGASWIIVNSKSGVFPEEAVENCRRILESVRELVDNKEGDPKRSQLADAVFRLDKLGINEFREVFREEFGRYPHLPGSETQPQEF